VHLVQVKLASTGLASTGAGRPDPADNDPAAGRAEVRSDDRLDRRADLQPVADLPGSSPDSPFRGSQAPGHGLDRQAIGEEP
jgi:hypothetical protein